MPSASIRIATYNVRGLRDDRQAVIRVLRSLAADVVCIQEAPRFLFWRHRCRRLARASGLRVIGGGRAARANLLLAGPEVTVSEVLSVKFTRDRGLSLRGAVLAHITVRTVEVMVVGTHLDGADAPRRRHIEELREVIASFRRPGEATVIGVDVNAEPDSASWHRLADDMTDAASVTADGDPMTNQPRTPTRRIDALFVSAELNVGSTRAIDSQDVNRASDHRPVLAELVPTAG